MALVARVTRRPDPAAVAEWVERTCREQGVPVRVQDMHAAATVAALLTVGARGTGPQRSAGGASSSNVRGARTA